MLLSVLSWLKSNKGRWFWRLFFPHWPLILKYHCWHEAAWSRQKQHHVSQHWSASHQWWQAVDFFFLTSALIIAVLVDVCGFQYCDVNACRVLLYQTFLFVSVFLVTLQLPSKNALVDYCLPHNGRKRLLLGINSTHLESVQRQMYHSRLNQKRWIKYT